MSTTFEQTMATLASETVGRAARGDHRKDYRNACEGLPVLLLQSGLLATITWLKAQSQSWDRELGDDLLQHLVKLRVGTNPGQVLERLRTAPARECQVYFELALRAAVWQKRMAKALIPKEKASEQAEAANG